MVARVTLAEIDVVRMSIPAALRLYRESVLPAQHDQPGYEGGYVLSTPEGKALVMTFWATPEDAEAGLRNGFYAEQVQKFATIYRAAPGRELYDVSLAELPAQQAGSPQSPADGIVQAGESPADGIVRAGESPADGIVQAGDGSAPPAGAPAPPTG